MDVKMKAMNEQRETLIKIIDDVMKITSALKKTTKENEKFMPIVDRLLDHRNTLSKQIAADNAL